MATTFAPSLTELSNPSARSQPGIPRTSPHAHAGRRIVMQGLLGFWQRRILWADRRAIGPVRRTDGYITRIATKPASELRIADDDQRTGLRNLVEIGDP